MTSGDSYASAFALYLSAQANWVMSNTPMPLTQGSLSTPKPCRELGKYPPTEIICRFPIMLQVLAARRTVVRDGDLNHSNAGSDSAKTFR